MPSLTPLVRRPKLAIADAPIDVSLSIALNLSDCSDVSANGALPKISGPSHSPKHLNTSPNYHQGLVHASRDFIPLHESVQPQIVTRSRSQQFNNNVDDSPDLAHDPSVQHPHEEANKGVKNASRILPAIAIANRHHGRVAKVTARSVASPKRPSRRATRKAGVSAQTISSDDCKEDKNILNNGRSNVNIGARDRDQQISSGSDDEIKVVKPSFRPSRGIVLCSSSGGPSAEVGRKKNPLKPLNSTFFKQRGGPKKVRSSRSNIPGESRYWTPKEHKLFMIALQRHGCKDLKSISTFVGTRNTTQCRTHQQKCFMRLMKEAIRFTKVTSGEDLDAYSDTGAPKIQKDVYSVPQACGIALIASLAEEVTRSMQL